MKTHWTAAVVTMSLAAIGAAHAQPNYPERPIKLVVPYAPGGSADIAARLVADEWSKALGGTIVIENKGGAGGNIGVDAVAKSSADGYTIGLQTVSLAINPALFARMPYDTQKDLAPIGMVASSQHVLVVNNNLPAKDLKSLLAMLKAEPGKYTYGSAGPGSTFHMAAELFKSVANVPIEHIPYRGGGPALMDTIAGQVNMSFPVLSAAQQQVQAGKLRAIGVTGPKRSPLMPNVPTIAEAGMPIPAEPILFSKAITCLNGPNDEVELPAGSVKSDWEVELGVVIGSRAKNVSEAEALRHVAGYCVVNDVSEREYQIERSGGQWDKGKGFDTFGPVGPWLVTADEVPDPQALDMWLEINGERVQSGNTRTMIFGVAYLVSYISRCMTLMPGDVIATGTPPGVGMGFRPQRFLKDGDTMRLGIAGLGEQRQQVRGQR